MVSFMVVFLAIWIFEQSFSKAVSVFENDERFKAVERDRDRRELFDNYLVELKNKVSSAASTAPIYSKDLHAYILMCMFQPLYCLFFLY